MLDVRVSSAPRATPKEDLSLPIRLLLSTRGPPRPDFAFNVVGLVRRILGRHGDERASKVLMPYIFSGSATDEQIVAFVKSPWLETGNHESNEGPRTGSSRSAEDIRVDAFPRAPGSSKSPAARYDVVHYAGLPLATGRGPGFPLTLSGEFLAPGEFRDALVAMKCRLLVLQSNYKEWATTLAEWIVGSGGPSVLTVNAESAVAAERYFIEFYLNLLHNEGLTASGATDDPAVDATLHLATTGDMEWRLESLVNQLSSRLRRLTKMALDQGPQSIHARLSAATEFRHVRRVNAMSDAVTRIMGVNAYDADGSTPESRLNYVSWSRESDGVVPITRVADLVEDMEAAVSTLHAIEAEPAPRVLNANFIHREKSVGANEPLQPDRDYQLMVDIGPRWDKALSIVAGNLEFPAKALPPSDSGHMIDVVFASDDFVDKIVSGTLWLPDKGRSHPVVDGLTAEGAGPIKLGLRTPAAGGNGPRPLHGRLCLYFRNNLLQSAIVRATLASDRAAVETPNSIEVDYVLTGSFGDIERLGSRNVRPIPGEPADAEAPLGSTEESPVGFNLTLNDDGGGSHRIIIPSVQPPTSISYDPVAAGEILQLARAELVNLFWKRTDDGTFARDWSGDTVAGIDIDNGKTRTGFMWDLLHLATHGSGLFGLLFNNVVPPAGRTNAQWVNDLKAALARSTIIQIARTGSAQYAFPWSLVYDFPITAATLEELKFCKCLEQWDEATGRRAQPGGAECPVGDYTVHENKICPYGFWGVRHRIEQPPSVAPGGDAPLGEARRKLGTGGEVRLQAALTRDAALDPTAIANHVSRLSTLAGYRFAPPAAIDWAGVVQLLAAPELLYFLCHGEFDARENQPYLGVGLRDENPQHRVYVKKLTQVLAHRIDADKWQENAPLIIINGCHTANLEPGQVWGFIPPFVAAGASGVIGTEISVRLPVAVEAAEALLGGLASRKAVADAIWEMRWLLLNKGNLLGLAYTPYCLADLRISPG